MTGFDETVPPDPDPSRDAPAVENGQNVRDDNVVEPESGPEAVDEDDEDAPPMGGDPDIASGHLGE